MSTRSRLSNQLIVSPRVRRTLTNATVLEDTWFLCQNFKTICPIANACSTEQKWFPLQVCTGRTKETTTSSPDQLLGSYRTMFIPELWTAAALLALILLRQKVCSISRALLFPNICRYQRVLALSPHLILIKDTSFQSAFLWFFSLLLLTNAICQSFHLGLPRSEITNAPKTFAHISDLCSWSAFNGLLLRSLHFPIMAKSKSGRTSPSGGTTGCASSSDKPVPHKASGSPKKYTKKASQTASPQGKTASSSSSNTMSVFVCSTKPDDLLLLLERSNGGPPFWHPTLQYLNNNPTFRRENLHIHQVHDRVDPVEPERHRFTTTPQGRTRSFPVLVNILPENHRANNTTETRSAWAAHFVAFFNHPSNQTNYTYPVQAHYAGDLTPANPSMAPRMSEFLTVRDTMEVMREAFMDTGTELATVGDVMEITEAMEDYYTPGALERVQAIFASQRNHIPTGTGVEAPQAPQNDPFQDLPGFDFGS